MRVVQYSQCPPRSGAAAVELAVSLPLLLLLLLGCIDVGRFALRYICLSNAASEAATFASLNAPGQFGGGLAGLLPSSNALSPNPHFSILH